MAVFELKNTSLIIKINSFGAELTSVYSDKFKTEYIWQADKTIWGRHAPNLFPIVGRLKDNSYIYQNNSYSLPQHGFARDTEFNCVKHSETEITFELQQSEESLKKYPFHFTFQVTYTLFENNVTVSYSVYNPDKKDLLFSVGAHPAFNCPLQNDELFTDYILNFKDKKSVTINKLKDGLISSEKKSLSLEKNNLCISVDLFNNDALVFENNQIDEVALLSKKTNHGIVLTCHNWPFFGIWTKPNTNCFVCLEPWYGIADTENSDGNLISKTGIIKLIGNQRFNCHFKMSFI